LHISFDDFKAMKNEAIKIPNEILTFYQFIHFKGGCITVAWVDMALKDLCPAHLLCNLLLTLVKNQRSKSLYIPIG